MSKKISSAEYPLEKIFSSDFSFNIPCYQPPYTWDEEKVSRLFDDLYDAFLRGQEDIYFLGSIVLIKSDWYPDADVIDGQQRLTTLTIFLAVLAEEFAGEQHAEFQNYICQPACGGQVPKPRLRLKEHDRSFFADHVQAAQVDLLLSYTPADLKSESRINIQRCARVLRERLRKSFGNDAYKLWAFGSFLMKRCFLIVMSTPTLKSSIAILAVQNIRRRDYFPTQIIESAMAPTNQMVIKLIYDGASSSL